MPLPDTDIYPLTSLLPGTPSGCLYPSTTLYPSASLLPGSCTDSTERAWTYARDLDWTYTPVTG